MTKKKKQQILAGVMIFFFAIAVLVGYKSMDIINKFRGERVESLNKAGKDDRINVLILGQDTGTVGTQVRTGRGRTDTIMVASFDPVQKEVKLLSIPRDSRVNIPGRGMDKLNHAHAFGGVDLTVKTVQELLGVPIHHYVRINFDGFVSIVDVIGGVTVTVEKKDLKSFNYDRKKNLLQVGTHKLDGDQALEYVRIRNDDIGRVERQQKFIAALMRDTLQVGNIWRSPAVIESIADNVDTDMSLTQMIKFAGMSKGLSPSALESEILPGKGVKIDGVSYWELDQVAKEEIVSELFKNKPAEDKPAE